MCFFIKQKTAYEMRISDWSSDVCSSDLMLEDIRKIKQGNFNAVPATLAGRYRLWYELCGEHGVYVLDRVMHPSQEYGLHGTGSNPALLTVPQETLTGDRKSVV